MTNNTYAKRGMRKGAFAGTAVAAAILLSYLVAGQQFRSADEGLFLVAYLIALVLGAPTTVLLSWLMTPLERAFGSVFWLDPFSLLLFGIVINWGLVGWWLGRRKDKQ